MKFSAVLAAILPGITAAAVTFRTPRNRSHALRASHLAVSAAPNGTVEAPHHKAMEDLGLRKTSDRGNKDCRCVGIHNANGSFLYDDAGQKLTYPADYGTMCKAWEKDLHPDCKKEGAPDWCFHEWCFVDPCDCDIPVLPKKTTQGTEWQGRPVYWSYATCGHADTWSAAKVEASCTSHKTLNQCYQHEGCAWTKDQCVEKEFMEVCNKEVDEELWGQDTCQCIGLSGREGTVYMLDGSKENKMIPYPADVGAHCGTWEQDHHPDCKGPNSPPWCHEAWCWVDPCSCRAMIHECGEDGMADCAVPPKVSVMKNWTYQGKNIYFSYETCGSHDTWTQGHREQYCLNQRTAEKCATLGDRCHWTGLECVGKDLATQCGSASALRPMAVIIATLSAICLTFS